LIEERTALRLSELAALGALALRRQVHDLFALLDLPTHWQGREPREIAQGFIEVITQLARLDVALIHLQEPGGVLEQRFPAKLDSEALLAAAQSAGGSGPATFELPEPNSVGHRQIRVISISPLGEQGVIIAGSWRQNFPTAHERLLLQTATNQAMLAMQSSREARAQRSLAEERSRLERANLALARLHAVSDGLSRAHTSTQIADVLLSQGLVAMGAQAGSLYLADDTQSELRLVPGTRSATEPPRSPRAPRRILIDTDLPLAQVFRERQGRYLAQTQGAPPARYGLPRPRPQSVAVVPLRVDTHCLGVLSLGFAEPRSFADDERAFIQAIAQQTAQACDRARLLEAEQRARQEAEERQQYADLLSEASAILGSSLDFPEALTQVAHLVVPRFADWVTLQVSERLSSSVEQTRTVVVHRDPSKTDMARDYSRSLLSSGGEVRTCLTNNSAMAPIRARGQALGALLFGTEEPGRYGPRTLELIEELALRAGVALENAQLYQAAREADRRKDEFLAMLGHELRNPLSPILIALELMRRKTPHACEQERAIIEGQVEHMVRLVDDLLDVSRITRGKIQLKRERIDPMTALTRALEMTAPLLEQCSHHLELVSPPEPLLVEGDKARLAQILANLLNNAAKYTPPGGRIRVSVSREGGHVVLSVKDSGSGIPPEILPKIFEMFVQDSQTLDRSRGGLGLGLAIVHSLVELHGGTVSAHSEGAGRGSEFVVRLPLAKTRPADVPEPGPAQPSGGSALLSLRILVVDDNQDAAELLTEALELAGFITRAAFDGPSGLEAARDFCPDVALLDIGLPGMDGYELAQRLRAHAPLRDMKLIALTGYGQDSDRHRAMEARFDLHMVKPVDFSRLLGVLRELRTAAPEASR
jgi:signal transduction histidine kinase/ActR/RegA family two-component response regulator